MSDIVATAVGDLGDPDHHVEEEQKVTPLELFFDLVFVFAITQVTAFLAAEPTWRQLARGILILGALWWTWVGYAWLTNRLNSDEGLARFTIFLAMAGMLVVALATPTAFSGGATTFAIAYLIVRQLQTLGLFLGADKTPEVRLAIRRLAVTSAIGPLLILAASGFDGPAQGALWAVSMVIDFGGGWLSTRGDGGWQVHAGHFAERHSLIIIIALGESIVALGVGAEALGLGTGVLAAGVIGVALVGALWWSYFDVVAIVAERRLARARGVERGELARDSYSYLHFLMMAGIVLLALGIKKTLNDYDHALKPMPAFALCGGAALYYLGHIGFRLRNVRSLSKPRTTAVVVLLALVPLATEIPALLTLALVTAVCIAVVTFEAIRYADARDRVRHAIST